MTGTKITLTNVDRRMAESLGLTDEQALANKRAALSNPEAEAYAQLSEGERSLAESLQITCAEFLANKKRST